MKSREQALNRAFEVYLMCKEDDTGLGGAVSVKHSVLMGLLGVAAAPVTPLPPETPFTPPAFAIYPA